MENNKNTVLANYRTDKLKYWNPDEFEDLLTRGMISLFESKFIRNRGANPSTRLDESIFKKVKKFGLWIYSPDRQIIFPVDEDGNLEIMPMEIVNKASMCFGEKSPFYCTSVYVEKELKPLPKTFKRTGGGQLYSIIELLAHEKGGITGNKFFFSVDKNGKAFPCLEEVTTGRLNRIGIPHETMSENYNFYFEKCRTALGVMQFQSDSQYTWTISAIEDGNHVHIGCLESEVKSLTYARSMPLTATGRKRPILHFVSAHKRRIQSGIDIDISEYLRGITRFEMNGTLFEVKPPVIRNEVQ